MSGVTYIRTDDFVAEVTHSLDTSAYASGDLVADTQEIANVGLRKGGVVVLKSITILDKADQKVDLYLVFLEASTSLGTENSAPNISDTNAENILGIVFIDTDDYLDVGGAAVVTKEVAITLKLASGSTSLYVAIVNGTGTPTYGASDLVAKYGFLR